MSMCWWRGALGYMQSDLLPTGWAALRRQTQQLFTCRLVHLSKGC